MRKGGYRSGYTEYRYGVAKKPILARVLTGEKREHVVSQAMDLMKDWRTSPFENEGSIRHGLRSALCQDGHGWAVADHEAEVVTSHIFRLMGAHRPSFEQGQRQYTVAQEDCNWCALPIAQEDRDGKRMARFCSAECARSALTYRTWETRWKESAIGRSAFSILHRERSPSKACEFCGVSYKPFNIDTKDQRFCSHECARLSLRTVSARECRTCKEPFRPRMDRQVYCSFKCVNARTYEPIPCEMCERMFTPKHTTSRFCSSACLQTRNRIKAATAKGRKHNFIGTVFDGTCRHCHQPFMARSPKAIYCGPRCNSAAYLQRRRRGNVFAFPPLTPAIFDGWFKRAA